MSRSGYSDDCDGWALIRWRGAVTSASRGKRGQSFFKELLAALDAMPVKRLIANELEEAGEHCALGVLGSAKGMELSTIDPEDPHQVSEQFDIACALAKEVVYENDEGCWQSDIETPEARWIRVRAWVAAQITESVAA